MMTEINGAAAERPSIRYRWPKGIWGLVAYLYDHCVRRYRYPVNWHDLMLADESMSAIVLANVRAKLRQELGVTTTDQLAKLAAEYGKALKCDQTKSANAA